MKKKILLIPVLIFITTLFYGQVSFNFKNFKSETAGITLLADASIYNGVLRLTESAYWEVGACWYTDKTVDPKAGFITQFTFLMTDYYGLGGGADGFVFVIRDARLPITVTESGYGLGYHEMETSLAIEFDTYYNGNYGDPNNNHISVHSGGPKPNSVSHDYALGTYLPPYEMKNGKSHKVTIQYLDHLLQIFLGKIPFPILSISVDIDALLRLEDGPVWVGFTSSTGLGAANHDILNWSFTELFSKSKEVGDSEINNDAVFVVYPNPFTSYFKVFYTSSQTSHIKFELQNINGQIIKSIVNEVDIRGISEVVFDGTLLPPGIYFIRLQAGKEIITKKIIKH